MSASTDRSAINLRNKLAKIGDLWTPGIAAALNDYHVKLAKIKGDFVWHSHADTDELFLVVSGELTILLRDGEVRLREGEMYVVPRGVEHKPVAQEECHILMIEPAGTLNTGDRDDDERTVDQPQWL